MRETYTIDPTVNCENDPTIKLCLVCPVEKDCIPEDDRCLLKTRRNHEKTKIADHQYRPEFNKQN